MKKHKPIDTSKCCDIGSYEHQVDMPINGRRVSIDLCIADIVAALNAANIPTAASCCGHGTLPPRIDLEDGRVLTIINNGNNFSDQLEFWQRLYNFIKETTVNCGAGEDEKEMIMEVCEKQFKRFNIEG